MQPGGHRFDPGQLHQIVAGVSMPSLILVIVGLGFLVGGIFGREGDFRWGRTGKGPVMSVRLGRIICLVVGVGFTVGGAIATVTEFYLRR